MTNQEIEATIKQQHRELLRADLLLQKQRIEALLLNLKHQQELLALEQELQDFGKQPSPDQQ